MKQLTKIIITFAFLVSLLMGQPDTTSAATDKKQTKNQIILELKEEITELGSKPAKRGFKNNSQYIVILEEQLEKLKKEKKKEDALKLARDKKIKELEDKIIDLGGTPKIEGQEEIDEDEEIKALLKQIEELEDKIAKDKKKAEDEKKAKEEKEKAEKAKEKKKQERADAIARIKKEIYFLGGSPIPEFEVGLEDQYIAALRKQIEELKIQKESEEKAEREAIPEWYVNIPQSSATLFYGRGSFKQDNLDLSVKNATRRAKLELISVVKTRLDSKTNETIKQSGIGEDIVSKTVINDISTAVSKEIYLSAFKVLKTKIVPLEDGWFKTYILLEYPVGKALKAYKDGIDKSSKLRGKLVLIKDTVAYKELEKEVALYSGS